MVFANGNPLPEQKYEDCNACKCRFRTWILGVQWDNSYIAMFYACCVEKQYTMPNDLCKGSAIVGEFMCLKAEKSERPESMLTSILAALTAFNSGPLPKYLHNLKQALIKECTKRPKGRTPIMTVKPFVDMFEQWGENGKLTLKQLSKNA